MGTCFLLFASHILSASAPQHPPQCHCLPSLCCSLLSLLGRFKFRLSQPVLFQQETNLHASLQPIPALQEGSARGSPSPEPCLQLLSLERASALLRRDRGQAWDCSSSCSLWLLALPSCPSDGRCVLRPDFPCGKRSNGSQSLQWEFLWGMDTISPG